MATLTQQQIRHLSELMDVRFAREIDETSIVRERAHQERNEAIPADRSDAPIGRAGLVRAAWLPMS